jgi:hypothetical protein
MKKLLLGCLCILIFGCVTLIKPKHVHKQVCWLGETKVIIQKEDFGPGKQPLMRQDTLLRQRAGMLSPWYMLNKEISIFDIMEKIILLIQIEFIQLKELKKRF